VAACAACYALAPLVVLRPRRPPGPPLFPYTTLFRSVFAQRTADGRIALGGRGAPHRMGAGAAVGAAPPQAIAELWRVLARMFPRSEEHTSELQSRENLVCRLLLEKKNNTPAISTRQR